MTQIKPCSRCGGGFYASHGNQTLCGSCRSGRPTTLRHGVTRTFGSRRCALCWREFTAVSENQRFCCSRHRRIARVRNERKYASPEHRGTRRALAPVVASGKVRCARGPACRRAEIVDGERVGGFILPGESWHLGHPDGESVGGPEHVKCNTGAPSRLRGKMKQHGR